MSIISADTLERSVVTADAFPCATKCHFFGVEAVPCIFPRGAAPRLKHLRFAFPAIWMARRDFDFGMGHLPSLETVHVDIYSGGSSYAMVEGAEAALRAAAADHPKHPTISFY